MTTASVIVVGYGDESDLEQCLSSVASEVNADDEILLVDNGVTAIEERRSTWPRHVRVVTLPSNTGFAGGANAGAEAATGSVLVFVNSDLIVGRGSIQALRESVHRDDRLLATGSLRLRAEPDRINSAGNPVHFTGIAWAGAFGEPASCYSERREVASASGGFMAVDRRRWKRLGGFEADYFMYHEDVEFSLRWWMTGGHVAYVPDAVALHDYAFARNPRKMYYLERNRLITVLTVYPVAVLARVLPALVATELALLLLAARQGWAREKFRGYVWLLRRRAQLRQRRGDVQASFTAPPQQLIRVLSPRLDTAGFGRPVPGLQCLNRVLSAYWTGTRLSMR